jgi:uncharacterized protein with HEPN domain
MDKNYLIYLAHISEAIEIIEEYLADSDFEKFVADQKTVDAVIRKIEIIGEAASNVSEKFQKKYPEIAWRGMISARNRMIHGYFDINQKAIWEICKEDLPILKKQIKKILNDK